MRLLIPPRPIRRLSRHSSGTRGRSTQRPSLTSSAGSTVIEPSTATATTRIDAGGERVEGRAADDEQPGHRGDDRRTRDQDRVARGLRGDLDGVEGAAARGPLLALALEVEQRVVDPDGHADQHDHAADGGLGVDQVRERRGDADRGGDAGGREQHRDAGRDQGAEREQHQHQGDRQADALGGGEVLARPGR